MKSFPITREESVMVGGVAILLMIWHHLFMYPSWLSDGVEWNTSFGYAGRATTELLACFGNICVPVFAMISGYALCVNPRAYGSWPIRLSRLLKFLTAYWLVCLTFLCVGAICGDTLPTPAMFAANMFGLCTGPGKWVNVPFAWYVGFYVEFVVLTPLLILTFSSGPLWRDILAGASLILLVYLSRRFAPDNIIGNILTNLTPILAATAGFLAAKYKVFDRMHHTCLRLNAICFVILFGGLVVVRYKLTYFNPLGGGELGLLYGACQCHHRLPAPVFNP